METHLTFGKCASGLWESKLTHQQKNSDKLWPKFARLYSPSDVFQVSPVPF